MHACGNPLEAPTGMTSALTCNKKVWSQVPMSPCLHQYGQIAIFSFFLHICGLIYVVVVFDHRKLSFWKLSQKSDAFFGGFEVKNELYNSTFNTHKVSLNISAFRFVCNYNVYISMNTKVAPTADSHDTFKAPEQRLNWLWGEKVLSTGDLRIILVKTTWEFS